MTIADDEMYEKIHADYKTVMLERDSLRRQLAEKGEELREARERKKNQYCPDCGFQMESTERDVNTLAKELAESQAHCEAMWQALEVIGHDARQIGAPLASLHGIQDTVREALLVTPTAAYDQAIREAEAKGWKKCSDKILDIIAEFRDDTKTCAGIIGEHLDWAKSVKSK